MKFVKKITLLCLVFSILCMPAFAYNNSIIDYYGILPFSYSDNEVLTRDVLAMSASKLSQKNIILEPSTTCFKDVGEDNPYSGYISYVCDRGIMNGCGSGLFIPDGEVTPYQAAKVLIEVIGYGPLAEYKGGGEKVYMAVAADIGLFKGTELSGGKVTCGEWRKMVVNAINTPQLTETLTVEGNTYESVLSKTKNSELYGEKLLFIHEYDVRISSVDSEKYIATVVFEEDSYGYVSGQTKIFSVEKHVNMKFYENLPAVIVVEDDSTIIDISLKENVSVHYGVIDSINNRYLVREDNDLKYNTRYIEDITLKNSDEKYKIKDSCDFYYNGSVYSGKVSVYNKYVKIVEENHEIISVFMWDLTDAGIITKIDFNNIYYRDGNIERRITGIENIRDVDIIVDGEARGYEDVKDGMIFSYYINPDKDTLLIFATDKHNQDVFSGVDLSGNSIIVGNFTAECAGTIYFTLDGEKYQSGLAATIGLMNKSVVIRYDIYDNVCYIEPEGVVDSASFAAYIIGYKEKGTFNKAQLKMIDLESTSTEPVVYEIDSLSKIDFGDGIDIDVIKTSIDSLNNATYTNPESLYEVKVTSNGTVRGIKRLVPYEGYGDAKWTGAYNGTTFVQDGYPFLYMDGTGKCLYINSAQPVTCVYKDNGEYKVNRFNYSSLVGKSCSNIELRFYGYKDNPDMRMLLMTGNPYSIAGSAKSGLVEFVGDTIDENGDTYKCLKVDGKKYRLSDGDTHGSQTGDFVTYEVSFMEQDVATIKNVRTMGSNINFADWDGITYGNGTLKYGIIERADSKKIILEGDVPSDERCYYYQPNYSKLIGITDEGKLKDVVYQDLVPGMEVVVSVGRSQRYTGAALDVFIRISD